MTDVFSDPTKFPWRIDLACGAIDFITLTREQVAEAAFLDHRAPGGRGPFQSASISELLEAQKTAPPRASAPRAPAYIFHAAFCCSTLISRCLDAPGKALALKEPQILVDLSSARRFGGAAAMQSFPDLRQLIAALLARPFEGGERAIIKPSNGVNDLLADVLDLNEKAQALLLYAELRPFLISVIKRGETGRRFVRSLLHHPWGNDPRLKGLSPDQALQLTDLQAAALIWRLQTEAFSKALRKYPDRTRALCADDFLNDPEAALGAVDAFFETGLGGDRIAAVASGPLLTRDAKEKDKAYAAAARDDEAHAVEEAHGEDIDAVIAWAEKLPFPDAAPLASTLMRQAASS